eukprot:m.125011 g.125011  ORF g.125011 m.125011 type:complete len:232 (-) comp14484_c0_seq6:2784-3479(-)
MGCGSSKAVKVHPGDTPTENNNTTLTTDTQNNETATTQQEEKLLSQKEDLPSTKESNDKNNKADRNTHSAKSHDSGFNEENNTSDGKLNAPIIVERPKSRGGCAFDITYDEGSAPRPRRLKSLERRNPEVLDVEAKLRAAEKRREERNKEISRKLASDTEKGYVRLNREKMELDKKIHVSEDRAMENRERHLQQLRDRLRQKEERARRVRENKQRLAKQNEANQAAEVLVA